MVSGEATFGIRTKTVSLKSGGKSTPAHSKNLSRPGKRAPLKQAGASEKIVPVAHPAQVPS
jgi:hypothetical protein